MALAGLRFLVSCPATPPTLGDGVAGRETMRFFCIGHVTAHVTSVHAQSDRYTMYHVHVHVHV